MLRQIGPTEIILILLLVTVQAAVVAAIVYAVLRTFRGRRDTKPSRRRRH